MNNRGNHGLNMVLSVVVFLFIIGLVIFIFSIFGGAIITSTSSDGTGSINESITFVESGDSTSVAGLTDVQLSNYHVYECDPTCVELDPSNYTITGGVVYKN